LANKSLGENNKSFAEWVKNQNAGLWFGIGFLAYSVLFFAMSFTIPYYAKYGGPGPGMYPRWLFGIAIIIAIIYIWQSCKKEVFKFGQYFPGRKELKNVGSVLLACLLFMILLNKAGFIVAGSLLMFAVFFGHYKWWLNIILSIGITFICFVIFKVCFSIPLPVNMFGF